MKLKWYIALLNLFSIALACNWNPTHVPNQEILVELNAADNLHEISKIAQIEKRLNAYGFTEIEVSKTKRGNLKITYYSELDVTVVQALLDSTHYNFEVSNINPTQKPLTGIKGNLVVKQKNEADRFSGSNQTFGFFQHKETNLNLDLILIQNDYFHNQVDKNIASYAIPEVRAGPLLL